MYFAVRYLLHLFIELCNYQRKLQVKIYSYLARLVSSCMDSMIGTLSKVHVLLFPFLDVDTRKRDLERVFEKYGRLLEIWMARNPPCFAFVVYAHQRDADRAIKETDGMWVAVFIQFLSYISCCMTVSVIIMHLYCLCTFPLLVQFLRISSLYTEMFPSSSFITCCASMCCFSFTFD